MTNISGMAVRHVASVVLCALAAACSSAVPGAVAPSATTQPPAAATPTTAVAPPLRPASPTPTLTPVTIEAPSLSAPPEPTTPADYLISLAHAGLRSTCFIRDEIYDGEIASVTCGPDDLTFDYSLFVTPDEMNAAFDEDVAGAETPPDPKSTDCASGRHLTDYSFDEGESLGRLNCREHLSSSGALYHVLEWTSHEFLVIGYLSNRAEAHTWDELVEFWHERAGPIGLRQ
ncbi:MAG TPA: hypothetical protein VMZ33_04855 [Candidatus Limnocylindrales bacterium]|nr:hypothetical protein [Candidatus Limnocylindrales bacterium]